MTYPLKETSQSKHYSKVLIFAAFKFVISYFENSSMLLTGNQQGLNALFLSLCTSPCVTLWHVSATWHISERNKKENIVGQHLILSIGNWNWIWIWKTGYSKTEWSLQSIIIWSWHFHYTFIYIYHSKVWGQYDIYTVIYC